MARIDSRKLATILAIDMAGYSAQSERNQRRAIEYVAALRERTDALAAAEGGHIFNTAGDGLMLEFPIASGAVRTAVTLAQEATRNPSTLPRIRAGVHLGEVVIEGGDRLGHGVNVAARLMQMAPANGVVISEAVKDQLHGEIDAEFEPCGRVRLKKMREEVLAFEHLPGASLARRKWRRWRGPILAAGAATALIAATLVGASIMTAPSETPFVAVMPFDNLSGDPNLAYFSNGVSTEIQATLAEYQQGLRVAGLASSFRFHGANKDPANVRRQLGATHVVDGSVRREGSTVRIVAELIDARNGAVVWTRTYDHTLAATLETQAEIARRVGQLLHAAAPEIAAPPTRISPQVLEHYLRVVDKLDLIFSAPSIDQSVRDLEEATREAPQFARAWALLSVSYAGQSRRRNEDEQAALINRARDAARKALALDPHLALAEAMLGRTEPEWNWQARRQHYLAALALAPNDVRVLDYWQNFLLRTGRNDDASRVEEQILQLDPLSEDAQRAVVNQLLAARDIAGATRAVERLTAQNESSAILWYAILSDRENANDLAGSRRAMHELDRHITAIARDHNWSPEITAHIWDEDRREIEMLAHGPVSDADALQVGQRVYNDLMSHGGQGCVADNIPTVAANNRADLAWRLIETLYDQRGFVTTTDRCPRPVYPQREAATLALFDSGLQQMRRDPRIWRTFDAVGLTRYWRESNQWPDFCSDPRLPYDCRTIAAARR